MFWSDLDVALHQTALDLRGADGELADSWTDGLLFALGGPIYAGTNEIQRNIIAERLLGLPREGKGEVNFEIDEQQRDFAASIDAALGAADVPAAVRAWAAGDTAPGRKVWATAGRPRRDGTGGAGEVRRHRGAPGRPGGRRRAARALGCARARSPNPSRWHRFCSPDDERSAALASGELIATVALPPHVPRAVDADTAGLILLAGDGEVRDASAGEQHESVDPAADCST